MWACPHGVTSVANCIFFFWGGGGEVTNCNLNLQWAQTLIIQLSGNTSQTILWNWYAETGSKCVWASLDSGYVSLPGLCILSSCTLFFEAQGSFRCKWVALCKLAVRNGTFQSHAQLIMAFNQALCYLLGNQCALELRTYSAVCSCSNVSVTTVKIIGD